MPSKYFSGEVAPAQSLTSITSISPTDCYFDDQELECFSWMHLYRVIRDINDVLVVYLALQFLCLKES